MRHIGSRTAAILVSVAVLAGACGADEEGGATGPTTMTGGTAETGGTGSTDTTGGTGATDGGNGDDGRGEVVGQIAAVNNPAGFVDDVQVSTGDDIRARAFVSTDGAGNLDYVLGGLLSRCALLGSSEVRVIPEEGIVLSLVSGRTLCSKDPDSTLEITVQGPDAVLRMSDPVFAMRVVDGGSMVIVGEGFVEIEALGGSDALLLGPSQQSFVPRGSTPQAPAAMELDPEESAVMDRLTAATPDPDRTPPDPGASPTMARIRERGRIEVVTDEAAVGGGVDGFASTLLLDLSSSEAWDLAPPDVYPVDRETAGQLVVSGEADAFLTLDPPNGFSSVLMFADPDGRSWYLTFVQDPAFGDGLTRFVRAVLIDGTYGRRYVDFFDVQPSYEAVGSLISL